MMPPMMPPGNSALPPPPPGGAMPPEMGEGGDKAMILEKLRGMVRVVQQLAEKNGIAFEEVIAGARPPKVTTGPPPVSPPPSRLPGM